MPEPRAESTRLATVARGHLLRHGRTRPAFCRPRPTEPFSPSSVSLRALSAWSQRARWVLTPTGLHEFRHTFASLMIAAGVSAKSAQHLPGHSSIQITLDRYGHLILATSRRPPGFSTATCAAAKTSPDPCPCGSSRRALIRTARFRFPQGGGTMFSFVRGVSASEGAVSWPPLRWRRSHRSRLQG